MKRFTIYTFILFIIVSTSKLYAQSFSYEILDRDIGYNGSNSMALDEDGFQHIVYYDRFRYLIYTYWDGTTWQSQKVDENRYSGSGNSIAIDSQGRPHVSYSGNSGRELKYAFYNGSNWEVTIVDITKWGGMWTSIAIDSKGEPGIAYTPEGSRKLMYAKKTESGWNIKTLEGRNVLWRFTSLAFDKLDNPHISYSSTSDFRYVFFDGFKWNYRVMKSQPFAGGSAITIDKKTDDIHIIYGVRDNRNGVFYFNRKGGVWQNEVNLDPSMSTGVYLDITVDSKGYPHIVYGYKPFKYLYQDTSGWHSQIISRSGFFGTYNKNIALSCNDDVHFSYYVQGDRDLYSATTSPYGPQAFSLVEPANGAYVNNKPTLRWKLSSFQGRKLLKYELHLDGAYMKDIPATRCNTTIDSPLSDGIHTWTIIAKLTDGSEIRANETWSIRVDSSPPLAFNLNSPSHESWTANRSQVFSWNASSDAGSGLLKYQLYINGNLNQDDIDPANTSISPATALPDGEYTWYVVAVDNALNLTHSSQTWTIKVDNTPPNYFSLSSPSNQTWTNDTTPTFSWQATADDGIGLSKYELSIDGAVVIDSISIENTSATLEENQALIAGNHRWQIKAYDLLNNVRFSNTYTIRIDLTPPTTFSLNSPSDSNFVSFPTPQFSWNASQDSESGFSHYQLWIDNELSVDGITTTSTAPGVPLSEGTHLWYINAVDNVGNVRQSNEIWTVIWDATSPSPFDLLSPENEDTIIVRQPELSWNASNDLESGIKRYELWINGVRNKDVALSDTSTTPATELANGEYNWFVKAVDFAENTTSSTSTWKFIVNRDTNPPISNIVYPTNGTTIGGDSLTIIGAANDGAGSGVASVEVQIDSLSWQPVTNTGTNFETWEYNWKGFTEGTHTIYSRAIDNENNIEIPEAAVKVIVDRSTPSLNSLVTSPNPSKAGQITVTIDLDAGAGNIDNTVSPTITFSPANDTTKFTIQENSYLDGIWVGTAMIVDSMANGSALVQIRGVKNTLGSAMPTTTVEDAFTIDTVPPEISTGNLPPGTTPVTIQPDLAGRDTVNFTIHFSDSTSGIDTTVTPTVSFITAGGESFEITQTDFVSPGVWTGSVVIDSTMDDGPADIAISGVHDLAGNIMTAQNNVSTFIIDTSPPLPFSLLSPDTNFWTTEQTPLLRWNSSEDINSGLERYQLFINNNLNIEFIPPDSNTIRPMTPFSDSAYLWHVVAVDSAGNQRKSDDTRTINVDTTPPVTVITSPAPGDTLQESIIISGTADDGDGIGVDGVFISTDNGRNWQNATILNRQEDTSVVNWQYEWQVIKSGVRVIKSKSIDALGNASEADSGIVVQLRNFQPEIATITDTSALEDSLFTMQVIATDANPLDSLTFSDNSQLFEIKTKTSGRGLIEFTPENDDVGVHEITIYVSDGQLMDSTLFSLSVVNVNDAPLPFTLLSPLDGAETDSLNPQLSWSAAVDIDKGDSLYYQVALATQENFSDTLMFVETDNIYYTIPAGLEKSMRYFWQVRAIDLAGASTLSETVFSFTTSGIATDVSKRISGSIPTEFALSQNYPNPFNPETRINIQVPITAQVQVAIFNTLGQRIATLLNKRKQAGYYELIWDGKNEAGQRMSSGIYIVSMQSKHFSYSRKILLVQ